MNTQVDAHKGVLTVHITNMNVMNQHIHTYQDTQKKHRKFKSDKMLNKEVELKLDK